MANRYWVGGTGNWDASSTTNWSSSSGGSGGATTPGSSDVAIFDASSGGGTVTVTAAKSVSGITAGAYTGTLNTNNQSITTSGVFNISGSGSRTITLGSSSITVGTWTATTTTNLTFNSNTSTITMTGTGTFNGGGLTYYNVVSSGSSWTLNGVNTFTNLTKTGAASKNGIMTLQANQTISGTLTVNGNSAVNRVLITSSAITAQRTLTAGTVTMTNVNLRWISGAGAGSWNLSDITGGAGDCGGNSNITFTTASTQTWNGTSGGNWSENAWTTRVPLPQDTALISSSFGTVTITFDIYDIPNISFASASGTITATFTASMSIYGAIDFTNITTVDSGSFTLDLMGGGSHNIDTNGNSLANPLVISSVGGTYTLQDSITTTAGITLTKGTLNLNNYNLTCSTFTSSNANTRTLTMGSGTIELTGQGTVWETSTVTNFTLNGNTSTIKLTTAIDTNTNFLKMGGKTYYNLWIDTANRSTFVNILQGSNTFNDLKVSAGQGLYFETGTTQTVSSLTAIGDSDNIITLSGFAGWTISDSTGTNSVEYCNISYSTATGGATWNATNSVDGGDNNGWNFGSVVTPTGNFFQLF